MRKPTARDLANLLKEIPARMPGMPYQDQAVRVTKTAYKGADRFEVTWRDPAKKPDSRCKLWYRNWRHALAASRKINTDLERAAGRTSFTFDDAAEAWLKQEELRVTAKNRSLEPQSLHRYRRDLEIARAKFGPKLLHDIKSRDIQKWLLELGQDYSSHIFPTMIGLIGRVLNFAQQEAMAGPGWISPLTVERVRYKAAKQKRADIPDRSDMERLRDHILRVLPDGRIALAPRPLNMPLLSWSNLCVAIVMGGSCGLRVSEVCGLTWDRIDPETREVEVSQVITGFPEVRLRPRPKTDAGFRKVPTTIVAQEVINLHARAYKQTFGKCVGHVIRPRERIGSRSTKDFYKGTSLSNAFARLMRDAGLVKEDGDPKFTFHALRHWCASHWMKSTSDVHLVAKWLGHKNASMTLDVYGHCLDDAEGRAKFMKMPDWLDRPIELEEPVQPILLAPPESPLSELAPPPECPIPVPDYAERWLRIFLIELWRTGGDLIAAVPRGKSRQQVGFELRRLGLPGIQELKAMASSGTRLAPMPAPVAAPAPAGWFEIDVPDIAPPWVKLYLQHRDAGMDHLAASAEVRKNPKTVARELARLKLPPPRTWGTRLRQKKIMQLSAQGYQDSDIGRMLGFTGQVATKLRRELHKPNAAKSLKNNDNQPMAAHSDAREQHKKQLKLL
jgi:integrase